MRRARVALDDETPPHPEGRVGGAVEGVYAVGEAVVHDDVVGLVAPRHVGTDRHPRKLDVVGGAAVEHEAHPIAPSHVDLRRREAVDARTIPHGDDHEPGPGLRPVASRARRDQRGEERDDHGEAEAGSEDPPEDLQAHDRHDQRVPEEARAIIQREEGSSAVIHRTCCSRRQLLLAGAAAIVGGCATVPETGRSQLILMSASQEASLGLQAYDEILKDKKLSTDAALTAQVTRVGERIARATGKDFDWEFRLVDDAKQINAFALPGGKVAVYTGILPITQDDDGLAVVMGHEVAHATARHGAERMSQGQLAQIIAIGGGVALGGGDPQRTKAVIGALGAGASVGVILPFSRKQESEADRIGLRYMARAGYDPGAAVGFWQRMSAAAGSGKKPPEFLSTHPSDETRIRQIEAWLPEARAEFRPQGG